MPARCEVDGYDLPMMARSPDDRCCITMSVLVLKPPEPCHCVRSARLAGDVVLQVEDLRKTARGASSPAKPALHIPELSCCQSMACSCNRAAHHISKPLCRPNDANRRWRKLQGLRFGVRLTYPLSMTRAATSSVTSTNCQRLFYTFSP